MFSLFFTVSSVREAQLGFLLCAAVYVMFMLGYRMRWAQALTLLARVSLNTRLAVLENGGDVMGAPVAVPTQANLADRPSRCSAADFTRSAAWSPTTALVEAVSVGPGAMALTLMPR